MNTGCKPSHIHRCGHRRCRPDPRLSLRRESVHLGMNGLFSSLFRNGTRDMKRHFVLALAALGMLVIPELHAQISITANGSPYTQNFASLDTTTLAPLPSGWKTSKDNAAVRTVGSYTAALSATERRGGNAMSSTAANGIYNLGAGDAAAATERAIGFISSGSGTKSGTGFAWFKNNTGGNIASFARGELRPSSPATSPAPAQPAPCHDRACAGQARNTRDQTARERLHACCKVSR